MFTIESHANGAIAIGVSNVSTSTVEYTMYSLCRFFLNRFRYDKTRFIVIGSFKLITVVRRTTFILSYTYDCNRGNIDI